MKTLGRDQARRLGADLSTELAQAVKDWDNLFYLIDQPKHSLKMAQAITSYLATLATNEIALDAGSGARGEFIRTQAEANLLPELWQAVQLAGVGGMVCLKPYVSGGSIFCEVIPRSRIYVTRWGPKGRILEGFFTDYEPLASGHQAVRLERFALTADGLQVTNKAYRLKNVDELGGEMPLSAVARWADLEPEMLFTGVDRPYFGVLRMPFTNTVDASHWPVSLYANAVESIRELDRTWCDFLWERDTGRRRMIVDYAAVDPKANIGNAAKTAATTPVKDVTGDYFLSLDMDRSEKPWDDYTPELRVEQYQRMLDTQLRLLEVQAGFSPGTFQIDVKTGKVTATQVISEDKTTYNTVKAVQDRGLKDGLLDVLYWFDIYASLYGLAPAGKAEPAATFGDSIFEDTGVEFARRKQLTDSNILKPELLLSWYFGVSEEEAAQMMPAKQEELAFNAFGEE